MPSACGASCHAQKVVILGADYDPDIAKWDDQVDRDIAEGLLYWYGPGGIWWDTTDPEVKIERVLRNAPKAGIYESKADPDFE